MGRKCFKKWIIIALSILSTTLLLTGCMSGAEKAKGRKNEKIAKPIIEDYLLTTYGDFEEITNVQCIEQPGSSSGPIPDFSSSFSQYVKAEVEINSKTFEVIADTETNKCYDTYNLEAVKKDISSYLLLKTGVNTPEDLEIHIYSHDLAGYSSGDGFMTHDIINIAQLLQQNDYRLRVTCKYIDSTMDFSNINTDSFFSSIKGKCNINITFYNYVNSDRYRATVGEFQEYYLLKDSFSADKNEYFDYDQAVYIYPKIATISYSKFEHKTVNNIEFSWKSNVLDVTLTEKDVTDKNESNTGLNTEDPELTGIDKKFIILDITTLIPNEDLENYMDDIIYVFFDKDLKGKHLLQIEDNVDNPTDSKILEWATDTYVYTWLSPIKKPVTKLTVCLYE